MICKQLTRILADGVNGHVPVGTILPAILSSDRESAHRQKLIPKLSEESKEIPKFFKRQKYLFFQNRPLPLFICCLEPLSMNLTKLTNYGFFFLFLKLATKMDLERETDLRSEINLRTSRGRSLRLSVNRAKSVQKRQDLGTCEI